MTAVKALGRRCLTLSLDVAEPDAPERILQETIREFDRADILLNNAGIIRREPFLEFTTKSWRDVLDLNLDSVFRLSQVFANDLVRRSSPGKIIQVASMLSFQGGVRVASYSASKSAIHGLTKSMANELAAFGINVNAVAPGYIATENTAAIRTDVVRNHEILSRIPARRWGKPEDLQGAIVFLASRASDYMHGFTLAVDGGWLAS